MQGKIVYLSDLKLENFLLIVKGADTKKPQSKLFFVAKQTPPCMCMRENKKRRPHATTYSVP